MSPFQRQTLSLRVLRLYLSEGGRQAISPECFRLQGAYVAFPTPSPRGGDDPEALAELSIYLTRTDGEGPRDVVNIPPGVLRPGTEIPQDPALRLPPPLPTPLPEALWKPAGRTDAEEKRFGDDRRLNRLLPPVMDLPSQRIRQLLGDAAAASEARLISTTSGEARLLAPGTKPESVRDLLTAIEARTGGRWRPRGEVLALQQDPNVERLLRTVNYYRYPRAQEVLAAWQQLLGQRSRKRLEELGALTPSDLTEMERKDLRSAVETAYWIRPDVAWPTTELKDVSIRLLAAEPEKQLQRRAQYLLPMLREGPSEPILVPWDLPEPTGCRRAQP
jgi:hypothetical protein